MRIKYIKLGNLRSIATSTKLWNNQMNIFDRQAKKLQKERAAKRYYEQLFKLCL